MITRERLEELFEYRDGGLYWRVDRKKVRAGDRAGATPHANGYTYVNIDRVRYRTHRLVWLLHYGQLPKFLDHVNGDKSDNRIENLRAATKSQNACNRASYKHRTLPKGVCFSVEKGKYKAQLMLHRKQHNIGYYHTVEEADAAVRALREKLHGEFARHE